MKNQIYAHADEKFVMNHLWKKVWKNHQSITRWFFFNTQKYFL